MMRLDEVCYQFWRKVRYCPFDHTSHSQVSSQRHCSDTSLPGSIETEPRSSDTSLPGSIEQREPVRTRPRWKRNILHDEEHDIFLIMQYFCPSEIAALGKDCRAGKCAGHFWEEPARLVHHDQAPYHIRDRPRLPLVRLPLVREGPYHIQVR